MRKRDSVAVLGGDSDLVFQGLLVTPCITHNFFVILPADGNNKSLVGGVEDLPSASGIPLDICDNTYRVYVQTT